MKPSNPVGTKIPSVRSWIRTEAKTPSRGRLVPVPIAQVAPRQVRAHGASDLMHAWKSERKMAYSAIWDHSPYWNSMWIDQRKHPNDPIYSISSKYQNQLCVHFPKRAEGHPNRSSTLLWCRARAFDWSKAPPYNAPTLCSFKTVRWGSFGTKQKQKRQKIVFACALFLIILLVRWLFQENQI